MNKDDRQGLVADLLMYGVLIMLVCVVVDSLK